MGVLNENVDSILNRIRERGFASDEDRTLYYEIREDELMYITELARSAYEKTQEEN